MEGVQLRILYSKATERRMRAFHWILFNAILIFRSQILNVLASNSRKRRKSERSEARERRSNHRIVKFLGDHLTGYALFPLKIRFLEKMSSFYDLGIHYFLGFWSKFTSNSNFLFFFVLKIVLPPPPPPLNWGLWVCFWLSAINFDIAVSISQKDWILGEIFESELFVLY